MLRLGLAGVFVALAAGLVLSLSALWIALPIGRKLGLTIRPRLYGASQRAITHLGGPALALGALAAFLLVAEIDRKLLIVIGAGAVLMVLGFVDDRLSKRNGVRPSSRVVVEALVSLAVWFGGVQVLAEGPVWLDATLTVIFLVLAANAFNLVDNMDGVAGVTGGAAAFGIGTVALYSGQLTIAALAAAILGACLAFLPFNLFQARIYLGDAGSLFFGFSLGASALMLDGGLGSTGNLLLPVVVLAVPFTDTAARQIARWVGGGSPFDITGGTDHLSHRLVRMGLQSHEAAFCHGALGLIAAAAAAFAVLRIESAPLMFALGLFVLIGLGFAFSARGALEPALSAALGLGMVNPLEDAQLVPVGQAD